MNPRIRTLRLVAIRQRKLVPSSPSQMATKLPKRKRQRVRKIRLRSLLALSNLTTRKKSKKMVATPKRLMVRPIRRLRRLLLQLRRVASKRLLRRQVKAAKLPLLPLCKRSPQPSRTLKNQLRRLTSSMATR